MGDGRRRRRRKNARIKAAPTAKIDTVADDMLELVFLRLPLPLHLVRAACTCRRWRRIIAADGGRVMRLLHGASSSNVIGYYRVDPRPHGSLHPPGRNPAFVPSQFWPRHADILADGDLNLDLLPRPESSGFCWDLADIRGGLLLLLLFNKEFYSDPPSRIVLYDPRRQHIRAIPLSAWFHGCDFLGAFLLGGEDDAGTSTSLSNFRVTCVLDRNGVARACMFSSAGGGRWTSTSGATGGGRSTVTCGNDYWTALGWRYFAGSTETSAYWTVQNGVLALDKEAPELSLLSDLPHELRGKSIGDKYVYELPPPMIRACLYPS